MLMKEGANIKRVERKKRFIRGFILFTCCLVVIFSYFFKTNTYLADEGSDNKNFMVYYRAWRDKTMKGVNTDLPDENWITMSDIPYGINIVNVFSYVPKGQEALAKPFYDKLKSTYAPELHSRGIQLVRGIDYSELLKINYAGSEPTPEEYDAYAKELMQTFVDDIGIDGLDIDMETHPNEKQIELSNGVIHALSKYIGPKSGTGRPFLYDTNASNLEPFEEVSDCFDFLAYQQYGSNEIRTARAFESYEDVLEPEQFVPGLTFPEELDNNRWHDAKEPYEESNMFKVARYSFENNLGGMFLYALDRDGRTYEKEDYHHIKPSNLIWTKTAIAESKGMPLEEMKKYARHFLTRISYSYAGNKDQEATIQKAEAAIEKAETLYDVNKSILGKDYGQGISSTFDPLLEKLLMGIDLTETTKLIDQADQILTNSENYTEESINHLETTRKNVTEKLAEKKYSEEQETQWRTMMQQAIDQLKERQVERQTMKTVFSIDAGRKYFSLDQLKALFNKAYLTGFTDVQLLLGNDALRFMLDDMSLSVNGKTYTSDAVKKAITKGNNSYYEDKNGNHLTQNEMTELVNYAKERNLTIIPVINSPGHMDAILVAMEQLGIKNPAFNQSERTVDLGNQEAVAFTKELIKKYVAYFAPSSKIFNFGGDEYANDVDTGGWKKLQDSGLYKEFVRYANDLAELIKNAGMRPMSFNDGIYYNGQDQFGTFDQDIIISYWTSGWNGYNVAKPDYFVKKGHQILNTNDAWYWVLGHIDSGIYRFDEALTAMGKKKITDVPAGKNIPIIGSMLCVWCDDPNEVHDFDRIYQLMDAFSTSYSKSMDFPADYSQVDEAIKTIPENLESYTNDSVKNLQDILASMVRGLRESEQERVDQFAQAVNQGVEELVKNEETAIDDSNVTEEKPTNDTNQSEKQAEKNKEEETKKVNEENLPNTGQQQSNKWMMIGLGILVCMGAGFLIKKREKK